MTHNKIKTLADFTSPRVALQNQLCPLQQKRGLRRVFLDSQLLQPPIEVLRNTKIHSHTVMVPNRYQPLTGLPAANWSRLTRPGSRCFGKLCCFPDATLVNPISVFTPASL